MSGASTLTIETAASRGSGVSQARLARWFVEHHALIWRTLRRLGLSPALAAQVTEQLCFAAAKEIGASRVGHREDERVAALRLVMRQLPRARPLVASAPPGPAHPAEESAVLMDRVLQEMSRPAVLVFILFELEGLPLAQIGRVMDMDDEAALHALMRAREEFTRRVGELRGASR